MGQFSIRDIERITGIKAHTLRIWEQRYQIPRPKRTSTNIRYYDDEDLKLLLNISLLSQQGHKISRICKLSEQEICELAVSYSSQSGRHSVHIQLLLSSMINLDEASFEKTLSTSILQFGLESTITEVIFPLMHSIGMLWQTGTVNTAYEHFISNLVRQKLLVAIDGQGSHPGKTIKKFLLFLPEGETHELGLLFANYLIRAGGHHTLYLGHSLQLCDLLKAATTYHPDFIFISQTISIPHKTAEVMLLELHDKFPHARLLLTGSFFTSRFKPAPAHVHIIHSKAELQKYF
jgi:DNA-binding transcriptional MerR regulator